MSGSPKNNDDEERILSPEAMWRTVFGIAALALILGLSALIHWLAGTLHL